ncbi:hypothetical protein HELRODRAFT_68450 [Helobdella robusta]|uniref:Acyl-CoA-binding domain-containing protein 6 n=1 Tax=Helobdella robusta TaxID=6412 RepID=T1FZF0_HELRO|nr:hypothetical protein HELRODRAFT_68450 [Helobdella robusta]ESN96232.1 hypothetical protein HELRODRAFT_68450 [Helobdella robusta]
MLEQSESDLLERFLFAANYVRTIHNKLGSDDLLYLYSRYKQALDGNCSTPRPGFFDFQGKQKWDAWKAIENKSKEESMLEYISKVSDIDQNWEDNLKTGSKAKTGLGLGVSKFVHQENDLNENNKSIFDFCQEGNLEKLNEMLKPSQIDDKDENGMSLLHWSCDRGNIEIVKYLLEKGANINLQDDELQTALHYAAFCNYIEVVKVLIEHGADCNIEDSSKCTAKNVATSKEIVEILSTLS